jgi:hypothetical protein
MPTSSQYIDYLVTDNINLPLVLHKLLNLQKWTIGSGVDALHTLDALIQSYVPIKLEVAVSLLDVFDTIEICVQAKSLSGVGTPIIGTLNYIPN